MKKIFIIVLALGAILFTACNNESSKENDNHDMHNDSTQHTTAKDSETVKDSKDMKAIAVAFTNVDAQVATSIKAIADHYLHIKNALTKDDSKEAASGGKAMAAVINKLDKSRLTAEQKVAYNKNEEKLKEHAAAVADNADEIKEQRAHFVILSETMYDFVKSFGAGRPLYHDHCPMAKDNQGAMWLSETEGIKNPYFGAAMLTCGSVEETIQ